jgi:Relaxase/Mobilisation nuclease domain
MIIKSLSRKARSHGGGPRQGRASAGERGGQGQAAASAFRTLTRYMNRGIETEDGKAVLWHNLYGSNRMSEDELVQAFEDNARLLRARANGNVLYHEILSFSRGHTMRDADLFRAIADIGDAYLQARAPEQLGYGVIHRDTDHIHLHLMVSANALGRPERVRLAKKEFADIQRQVERLTLERFPELAQNPIYTRERLFEERLKTDVHEQAMRLRTHAPSRKEALKARLHQMFERASSTEELAHLMQRDGISFYTRGQSVGIIEREGEGQERKHRLVTLGLLPHYEQMNERLLLARQPQAQAVPERTPKPSYTKERFPRRASEVPEVTPANREESPADDVQSAKVREREAELRQTIQKTRDVDERQDGSDRGQDDDFER